MKFLELTDLQKSKVYEQTALRLGIDDPRAVEKDLWVTTVLQMVFSLPYADKFVFKGGSSLSKVWKLIHRFSEDIDLAIDRELFGIRGDLTKKQLKKLRKASSIFVRDTLAADLQNIFTDKGLSRFCEVIPQPDGTNDDTYPEPRKIHITYPSVYQSADSYLQPEVLLEVGARSLFEPTTEATVTSLIAENTELNTDVAETAIKCAVPQKTFLEKAFLLHELFSTERCKTANRLSRHLYDIDQLMQVPEILSAIHDDKLWEEIRHHREIFTSIHGVDYTPDIRRRINLIPPTCVEKEWRDDYAAMQTSMICGESVTYDTMISHIRQLQDLFRNT